MNSEPGRGGEVDELLVRLRHRQRCVNGLRFMLHGLLLGTTSAALGAAVAAVLSATELGRALWIAGGVTMGFAAAGLLVGLLWPIDHLHVARALDRAAGNEDRFASAVQLLHHHRRTRVNLLINDALSRVPNTSMESALPLRWPRSTRWIPVAVLATIVSFWLAPQEQVEATVALAPAITSAEWARLEDELREDLEALPKPQTPEEEEILRRLEQLASLISQKPSEKEALAEMARLREEIRRTRDAAGFRDLSMKNAANALAESAALKSFAEALRNGDYKSAAGKLRSLAEKLKQGRVQLNAADFTAISSDLSRLARQLSTQEAMQQACEQCANAADSMNRDQLADALQQFADQLQQNADMLRQSDNLSRAMHLLEQFQQQMNRSGQCSGCAGGCSACQGGGLGGLVRRPGNGQRPGQGAGKGGLRAGWGSARDWQGGAAADADEKRLPTMAQTHETDGVSTSYTIVSNDERAESGLSYEELYAELVHKSEADLELESVPVAYREYLRRYFGAIKPNDKSDQDPQQQE